MFHSFMLGLGMLALAGPEAPKSPPPPSPAQQELQAPMSLGDENPARAAVPPREPSGWRALGPVLVVLGLAAGGLWALKKWGKGRLPGGGGTKLRVEETLALGDRRFVTILKVEDERFLVALAPQSIALLAKLEPETPPPADFEQAMRDHLAISEPKPLRDVEALLRGNQP